MGDTHMRSRLTRIANFVKPTNGGDRHVSPPDDVVADVLIRDDCKLPALEAIVESPVLRPDGSILNTPGYDPVTRLILSPAPGLEVNVPDRPTRADVDAALDLLNELLHDFPFASQADRANTLGFLLTSPVRPAIAGSVPLALIDGSKAGTGKGLLANASVRIATGRQAAMLTPAGTEDEWKKTLLAVFAEGSTFVVIDEADELRSKALAHALTEGFIKDRVLGHSETLTAPVRATWAACGNNIKPRGDLVRRTYTIRLQATNSRPHERDGFLHPNLPEWIAAERGALLGALLTLARSWYAAGCPKTDLPAFGSFGEWTATVGGILAHAGIDGFLSNLRQSHDDKNDDEADWEAFLRALLERYGEAPFTTRDIEYVVREGASSLVEVLPHDLADAIGRPGVSFSRKLGKAFSKREDTRFGDENFHVARTEKDTRSGAVGWRVEAAGLQVSQVSFHSFVGEVDPPCESSKGGSYSGSGGADQTCETWKPADGSGGVEL